MFILKIITFLSCGGLMAWGGYNFKVARRFIMPSILAVAVCILTHSFWPLLMISAMATLSLGYGDDAVLSHVFGHSWGRSVYGLLVAMSLSLPLLLTHHIGVVFFALYLAQGFTLENALKNLNQIIGDIIIGCGFGSLVFFVR